MLMALPWTEMSAPLKDTFRLKITHPGAYSILQCDIFDWALSRPPVTGASCHRGTCVLSVLLSYRFSDAFTCSLVFIFHSSS